MGKERGCDADPQSVYRALTTVAGLRKGHTTAREPEPIRPVADQVVDATLPHLPAGVARLQAELGEQAAENDEATIATDPDIPDNYDSNFLADAYGFVALG